MPTIRCTTWVNAPLAHVVEIAQDNASFPEFMQDVKSLDIVEREGGRVVSDWVGMIPQFMLKVRWRQEDVWDLEANTCTFRQLEGDYDSMSGEWRFTEENGGTRFDSIVDYEYRVPGLGPLVAKVVQKIVQANLDNVLEAIKRRAEGSEAEP
ncbi:MAG: SRPBCC family protein [Fimbriimonadaceae bacterium]|nr:SRPBCC family protein [Fimbriimonadaceae bacterium]